jgi:hypothetical protein
MRNLLFVGGLIIVAMGLFYNEISNFFFDFFYKDYIIEIIQEIVKSESLK